MHHVGFTREIEVDLNRTSPAHHGGAHGADLLHIAVHQLVAALGHQIHLLMRPLGRGAQTDEAHADLIGHIFDLAQVGVHLIACLVDRLLFDRRPAVTVTQPFQHHPD